MRHSMTLAIGLGRDPALIVALALFVVGAAMVAVVSLAIVWRARLPTRMRVAVGPLQTQPSST